MVLTALASMLMTFAAPADGGNAGDNGPAGGYSSTDRPDNSAGGYSSTDAPAQPRGYTTDLPQAPPMALPPPLKPANESLWVGHNYQFDSYLYFYCTMDDTSQARTFYSDILQLEWIEIEGDEATKFLKSVQSQYPDATGMPTCSWNIDRYYQQDTVKHAKFSNVLGQRTPIDVVLKLTR